MSESPLRAHLRAVDGARLRQHLATRDAYERAFPLFFRAVGEAALARLADRFPHASAHVGEDCRSEARLRYPHLQRLPLDWVAFGFPGVVMWDLHVGCVADLRGEAPTVTIGIHATPGVWTRLAPALEAMDWKALAGVTPVFNDARAVGEKQRNAPARPLDLADLAADVDRVAERVARFYELSAPLPAAAGIVIP